jgi:biopolymer transport protein ExbB
MYAIAAVGALALAIALERTFWLYLRWRADVTSVLQALQGGDAKGASAAAGDTPLGDVLAAGLAESDVECAWEAMGAAAVESEGALSARVAYLATIGNVSTMLGLLGTVYGLILAFASLGDTASGERASSLSEGISTAMSTTAFGLVVGITALVLHAVLDARARGMVGDIEQVAGRVALAKRQGRQG